MKYANNILRKGAVFYLILLIVLSQSVSIIAFNFDNSDFYPGCSYQNGGVLCKSTGERSEGFYVFAGGSACCGCSIRHNGTLPDDFPDLNVKSVIFYLTTSRSNSYYTTIQNGPNDLKLILGDYESVATSVELSSKITDPVEHSWYLKFEFNPPVSVSGNMEWELLDGDDNIYSAVWLHASDLDQEGLPGIFENTNCQYAETRDLWYSVKFGVEGEIIDEDEEEEPEDTIEITDCYEIKEPGYYILKNDILNSPGMTYKDVLSVCILINSSDVVFDGDGYTIDGIDEMNSIGIRISGQSYQKNVTVKNVILRDWDNGLGLGVDKSLIEDNTFTSNNVGLAILSGSNNNTISNNLVSYNNNGLYLFGSKIRDNIIKDNKIIFNKIYGINITGSNNNLIYNNLLDNYNNSYSERAINSWYIDKTKTENIVNGEYLAGNAWYHPSSYGFSQTNPDMDYDDICDSVYEIDIDNIDKYPLASPRPRFSIASITIDNPSSLYDFSGYFRVYTFRENNVEIKVTIENIGETDGKAIIRLENFPDEIGKQIKMVNVEKDKTTMATFNFNISDYDEIDGWIVHGFNTSKDYYFNVNVTDIFGNITYDTLTDKISVKIGPKIEIYSDHDYDSDGDNNIEVSEYFLLFIQVFNAGDEDVSWIDIDSNYRWDGIQGLHNLYNVNINGLKANDVWSFDQRNAYILGESMSDYPISDVAETFQWQPLSAGIGRINFDVEYSMNNRNYRTISTRPATFSIYDNSGKTLLSPQVNKSRDFEVTVYSVSSNNVKAKIKNDGGVYYTFKINDEPVCSKTFCIEEFLNYLPPGWSVEKIIETKGLATSYKFKISYYYSSIMNTLDGLANAVSPLLPSPLDNIPLLLDLLLIFGADEIDETKLAELGAGYLIDQLKNPNSPYTKKIISEISKRYGKEVADQFTEEALGELVSLPMAFYKGFQWAWNNIKADKEHSFNVIVVDPPEEYTVTGEPIEDIFYIGSQSDITSNSGEGEIQISLNKEGMGDYKGLFEIDTEDTSLSEEDFVGLSKIIINEKGKRINNKLEGEVFIEVYFTDEVTSNAYDLLLSDVGLSESLIKSYFNKLEYYNSKIENDHILLYGRGDLLESSFHNEINNTISITNEKIIGEYHYSGDYLELSDDTFIFNLSLGSFLNIPLKNTITELNIPMKVETISPNTDKIDGNYIWYETPSRIVINGKIDRGTPGFEFILIILSILFIIILMWNRKKII